MTPGGATLLRLRLEADAAVALRRTPQGWTEAGRVALPDGPIEVPDGDAATRAFCDAALTTLHAATRNWPGALRFLAACGVKDIPAGEDLSAALDDLRQAMIDSCGRGLMPERDAEFHIDQGLHRMNEAQFPQAAQSFRRALELAGAAAPKHLVPNILEFLASALDRSGEAAGAADAIARSVALRPRPRPGSVLRLIDLSLKAGREDAALGEIAILAARDDLSVQDRRRLSRFAARAGAGEAAVAHAAGVVAETGADDDLLHLLNVTNRFAGEAEAVALTVRIPANTALVPLRLWQVRAFNHRGDHAAAAAAALRLAEEAPGEPEAQVALAQSLFRAGDPAAALPAAEAATALRPDHGFSHFLMARILAALGRRAAAVDAADMALRLDPGNPNVSRFRAGLDA